MWQAAGDWPSPGPLTETWRGKKATDQKRVFLLEAGKRAQRLPLPVTHSAGVTGVTSADPTPTLERKSPLIGSLDGEED